MNDESSPARRRHYVPELDGLRAIAILLVISTHIGSRVFHFFNGHLGVVLFFVLSGYLITTLALSEESATGTLSLRAFYTRRAFRIFPLYYLILALYCLLIIGLNVTPEKRQPLMDVLPFYLLYLQEIPIFDPGHRFGVNLPFYQSWSLGIEEKFYLAWPVICFVALRARRPLRIPATMLLIGIATSSQYTRPYAAILVGCTVALVLPACRPTLQRCSFGLEVSLALLIFIHVCLAQVQWPAGDTLYAVFVGIFLSCLLCSSSLIRRLLSFRPLAFIGKISYGIYLIHVLLISSLRGHFHQPILYYFVIVALSVGLAAALHFFIEAPLIKMGRQLAAASVSNV